jgi:hypothetical protein
MRDYRVWGEIGLLLILGFAVFFLFGSGKGGSNDRPSSSSIPATQSRATSPAPSTGEVRQRPSAASTTERLNQPEETAREDIAAVHLMLTDYRKVFGQVPEGGLNEEITRGLRGDNPKKLVFLVEKSGTLNAGGELIDRWGSPYFFHKLSRDRIDLRSAGPDRQFWTSDDFFDPPAGGPPL